MDCAENCATLVGTGVIAPGTAVLYRIPLPEGLDGIRAFRALTVTLGWFSPVNPRHQGYRMAGLDVSSGSEACGDQRIGRELAGERLHVGEHQQDPRAEAGSRSWTAGRRETGDPDQWRRRGRAFSDLQADIVADLIRRGIEVHAFNQRTVTGILDMIRMVGAVVGVSERAEELVGTLEARLAEARRRSEYLPKRPRVFFEEWNDPLISGIGWVSELIEIAGASTFSPTVETRACQGPHCDR